MESEGSNRPDSPKKKLRASSSTHDVILPDCSESNSDEQKSELNDVEINGLAPTRKYTSSEANRKNDSSASVTNEASSIQEEVVSSSENVETTAAKELNTSEGAADSASKENDSEIVSSNGPENKLETLE